MKSPGYFRGTVRVSYRSAFMTRIKRSRSTGATLFLLITALLVPGSSQAAPAPLPDNSLYQLETQWTRDDGRTLHLADLRGKTRVLTMFFSHCNSICPMITGQLKLIDREMPADLRKQVGFVMVTLDPESDTTETLAQHRKRMDFSEDNWILLQGRADDTRELANLLGVTYMPKKEDGQIDHNGLIVVLDPEGRIVEKTTGIKDRKAFMALLQKTVKTSRK